VREVVRTPTLEARASKGNAKFWFCRVLTDGTDCYLQSEAWQTTTSGEESKHLVSEPAKVTPKNLGKKNETTPEEQARAEMQSKLERQLDKGYHEQGKKTERVFTLPMLAHSLSKKLHTVSFPVYVQPKFNGIRCLYNSEIGFWSRQGNELIQEVTQHLQFDTNGETIDGELILPAPFTFQQTISAIKKYDSKLSSKLIYRVYDSIQLDTPFRKRWAFLERLWKNVPGAWILAQTELARTPEEITAWHKRFVAEGFEGTIIRSAAGLYTPGHRSSSLLKYKDFQDEDFEIIGFEDGKGKDDGAIIFACKTPEGREFNVRPEGAMEERRKMFAKGKTYIGKKLTVRFQVYTDDRVPLFPVGVAVRDYE